MTDDILTSITLSPSNPTISIGQVIQLSITCRNQNGNIMECPVLTITNSNPSVATYDVLAGSITGIAIGTTIITATYTPSRQISISGSTAIVVIVGCPHIVCGSVVKISKTGSPPPPAPDIATITLSPDNPSISVNSTVQMTATCKNSSGDIIECGYLLWTVENTDIASVDSSGLVTTKSSGITTIKSTALSNLPKTGSTTLTVAPH